MKLARSPTSALVSQVSRLVSRKAEVKKSCLGSQGLSLALQAT